MSYDEFQATRYFPSLDALRGAAILAVLWHHTEESITAPVLITRGYLGVDLFFILSGFLITTILLREKKRTGTISFRNFYVRRSLRIFPLYFAFLFFLCVVAWLFRANTVAAERFFNAMPYYLTYTSNWIPKQHREPSFFRSWSLSVEEQFYLIWPALFVLLGRKALWTLPGFIILVLVGKLGVFGPETVRLFNHLVPFSAIAIGVILALLLDRPRGYRVLTSVLGRRGSALAVTALLLVLLSFPGPIDNAHTFAVHVCLAALVCSVVVKNDHDLNILTGLPLIVHIGIVSYGIYVLHGALDGLAQRASRLTEQSLLGRESGGVPGVRFLALTVISTIAATISYYFFESYFLRLKKRYSSLTKTE